MKPSPKYNPKHKIRRRTRCASGIMGERSRLQTRYNSFLEFVCFDVYGISERLGFESPQAAWAANPIVESSIVASDLRVVK